MNLCRLTRPDHGDVCPWCNVHLVCSNLTLDLPTNDAGAGRRRPLMLAAEGCVHHPFLSMAPERGWRDVLK
jgi:hypothetical protein